MKLNVKLAELLGGATDSRPPPGSFGERRARFASDLLAVDSHGPVMAEELPFAIPAGGHSLNARLFVPQRPEVEAEAVAKPLLLFFHGGGWIQGSIETHASLCRYLAHCGGILVASVEYRLAPEHPFPAPLDDAIAATRWLGENIGALGLPIGAIFLGGDSAGGNLAAAVAALAPRAGLAAPAGLLLLYPALDLANRTPSRDQFASGYWLDTLDELIALYIPDEEDRLRIAASPALAPSLVDHPPAFIVTAGYDPLRDEAVSFASRLIREGGMCRLWNEAAMIHGFLSLHNLIPEARISLTGIATAFGRFAIDGPL